MSNFESKKQQVRRELEKIGYRNIPEHQLDEFTADLRRLICHDRASRASRSQARSAALSSVSSRSGRDSSFRDCSPSSRPVRGVSARSSQYYRPDPDSGLTSTSYRGSPRDCGASQRSTGGRPRRKVYRCVGGRRVVTDETTSGYSDGSPGSEFVNLRPEMDSDGTPDCSDDYDEDEYDDCADGPQPAMCARPFPRLHVNPVVPPELLPNRPLARPGFRVTADMLAHPIRSDPCTRMKWYSDYWATLKIPGIYRHHNVMNAVRNMLDTYDYLPRPLNKPEPVWNVSLLREQPTAMVKLNWC
ncbi:hypothetical protein FJT64_017844 [Amphibalanus amphitrite]|uniref:Centriolar and ciliogenesis-associated protein HYLS1 C-terminal domain-containing protein n=1 Tax=Amphibalanus amphitrite TaxID=1232801 RepID=A0A6A4X5M3_AMPAM|nr:hypothetical protein FJT64_017844 [Amphibalanus amphitrite]